MLSIHSAYPLQILNLPETNITTVACSQWACSKPGKAEALKLMGRRHIRLLTKARPFYKDFDDSEEEQEEEVDAPFNRFRETEEGGEEMDYDRDPELAEFLGECITNPEKTPAKMADRLKKKKDKIFHSKSGSQTPMKVTFNKFDFSDSYIWFEFYNTLLEKDVELICDVIRSWHIIGRLGGCNSMNMQLSQKPVEKRPTYDIIQGANVEPTSFYNIGDFEIQDNLARVWVDIGTIEPLLLDMLLNALTQINSDFVGIKQVVFGGKEFEDWTEDLNSEDAGCSVHTI